MSSRWWIYQRERFPLAAHGPLVIVFCASVMSFSALQQNPPRLPGALQLGGAIVTALVLFFQLRVADEFKDAEIDARFRPQRPVPRGLVALDELAAWAIAAAVLQFFIALALDVGLVPLLVGMWIYLGLMTREFFVPEWLRRRPVVYLLSHMLIMPMIAFYVSAFDWLCMGNDPPEGLGWLLLVSFFTGLALELGRKIKAPPNERPGVETYSALWGPTASVWIWLASIAAAAACSVAALPYLDAAPIYPIVAGSLPIAALATAAPLLVRASRERGNADRGIEPASGLVTLTLYLCLGPAQLLA